MVVIKAQAYWHIAAGAYCSVNRKRVQRLMRQISIVSVYPNRNTSRRNQANHVYPCLLTGLTIGRPKHIGIAEVTYIPMAQGFFYLVAIIDW